MSLRMFTNSDGQGIVIDHAKVTRFLTAVGEPIRLQIIFVLKGDRLNVGEISSKFDISRPAISHHLRILREAGVVQSKKEGQEVYYWLDKPYIVDELRQLANVLEQYISND